MILVVFLLMFGLFEIKVYAEWRATDMVAIHHTLVRVIEPRSESWETEETEGLEDNHIFRSQVHKFRDDWV